MAFNSDQEMIRKWVSGDSAKHQWIKRYLKDNEELERAYIRDTEEGPLLKFWKFRVEELEEGNQADIATFLHWLYGRYREGIIEFNRMKSAWSQKKYRAKLGSKQKKVYNFVMSVEAKGLLKRIAQTRKIPINQTIERLIVEEVERITGITPERESLTDARESETLSKDAPEQRPTSPKPYQAPTNLPVPFQFQDDLLSKEVRRQDIVQAQVNEKRARNENLKQINRKLGFSKGCALKQDSQRSQKVETIQKNTQSYYRSDRRRDFS